MLLAPRKSPHITFTMVRPLVKTKLVLGANGYTDDRTGMF